MRFWTIYFLVQISFFGTVLGRFSQRNFEIFNCQASTVAITFTQPPPLHPTQPRKSFQLPCTVTSNQKIPLKVQWWKKKKSKLCLQPRKVSLPIGHPFKNCQWKRYFLPQSKTCNTNESHFSRYCETYIKRKYCGSVFKTFNHDLTNSGRLFWIIVCFFLFSFSIFDLFS